MRIAKEGIPFILIFAAITAVAGWASVHWFGVFGWTTAAIGGALTAWCVWFFRDPERSTPNDPLAVISPADGLVCSIGPAPLPAELGADPAPVPRVCVFMNVFNVHVNRVPVSGSVRSLAYTPGKFFNASLDKASVHNERQAVLVRTPAGADIAFVQIAGLIARRIVCRLRQGQNVVRGDRFGLIRFGSRVDVYLPAGSAVSVRVGDRAVAGETVLAHLAPPPAVQTPEFNADSRRPAEATHGR